MNPGTAKHELLTAVDQIGSIIAREIDAEESAGRLSKVTHDALYDAGILRMKLPRDLGGFEMPLPDQFEVLEALARVHPAAAWCAMVGGTSISMPGAFLSQAGIERMFPGGRIPRGAIVIMATGRAEPVDGGFKLNGRWSFASGVHHAEWIAAHGMVDTDTGPSLHMFCFPAEVIEVHDNWQVVGLRSTGSCDISVSDVFVPQECAWCVEQQPPQRGGALYQLGIPAFVAYEHAAFACGVARAALDYLSGSLAGKKRGYGPDAGTLGDRQTIQRFVGHSDLRLRAARGQALELNAEAMDAVSRDGEVSPRLALEIRASAAFCTEIAGEITRQVFRYAGAGSLYEGNPAQRLLRDIEAAAQHLMVSDMAFELLGRMHMGDDSVGPMD